MAESGSSASQDFDQPPGTFLLIKDEPDEFHNQHVVMLNPVPSSDPNEPLNWSTTRKACNFALVLAVTCLIFTALSIQSIFWQFMVEDLHVTYEQLNQTMSVNYVGLALGCVFFIPLAKKFGRRPIYLVSTALMLATSLWTAELKTLSELYVANLLQGLAGATNEAIAQITIADLFFVHHRGGMNALYMTMVMIGNYLTAIAAGVQATQQGWRWSYRTLGIFNAVLFLLFILFYEETKYSPVIQGVGPIETTDNNNHNHTQTSSNRDQKKPTTESNTQPNSSTTHELDPCIPMKPWRQRFPLITYTPKPIWPHLHRPFEALLTFPAILCCALQYASGIVWLTILANVISLVFPLPPYNFTPAQIGYMSVGPFVGNLIGAFYGGFFGDWSILFFARRNRGFYEPEMRLYILYLPAAALCGGLIMFGVTVERGMHWILPSIGGALFGFGFGSISDACLTLVIDSYMEITGDAFTGIAFLRNAFSIGIPFAITPWMQRSGLTKMFLACGLISLGVSLTLLGMVWYGKRMRRATRGRYRVMAGGGGIGRDSGSGH